MEPHEIAALEVEAAVISDTGEIQPLAGQVFYILDRSTSDVTLLSAGYAKAIESLKNQAIKFFITDSRGKAEIKGLKMKTYYICGVSKTPQGTGIWNVRINLKPGQNRLVLDSRNMSFMY